MRPQELDKGDMCLLDVCKWKEFWPQVAEVMKVEGDSVTVRWYYGGRTGKQKPVVLLKQQAGKGDWLETVQKEDIWFHGFKLTPGGRLSKTILDKIDQYRPTDLMFNLVDLQQQNNEKTVRNVNIH